MPFFSSCPVIATSLLYYEVAMSLSGIPRNLRSFLRQSSQISCTGKLSTTRRPPERTTPLGKRYSKRNTCDDDEKSNQADAQTSMADDDLFVVIVILLAQLVYVRQ